MKDWEAVIGLEIHAELNTESKLFSVAPNRFGDEPNTNITEVCTGMPGALPVLNKEAVRKAVQFGLAIKAKIAKFSKFDRKSYFYPDSPRNFQITQFDKPIILGGEVIVEIGGEEKKFQIDRVHLEDDAGMLKHFSGFAGVDYNRAGVPLIEIVSEPCMRNPKEAVAFAIGVKSILQYLNASDCNMQEGSLRFDANVSVRKRGEKGLRCKTEIKNMNSFSNMQKALESEITRQIKLYTDNPDSPPEDLIGQATYRFDPETQSCLLMRKKEYSEDYRYFPEPDLVPIMLSDEYIAEIEKTLPELPLQREQRYVRDLSLPKETAFIITGDKALADYFDEALKYCNNARLLANWLIIEFAGRFKNSGSSLVSSGIAAKHVGFLISMIETGVITGKIAKAVADEMVKDPLRDPKNIVAANPNYQPLSDQKAIESVVDRVIAAHPQSVKDYRNGKDRAFGFLVGQVMKETGGKASPQIVNKLLREKI